MNSAEKRPEKAGGAPQTPKAPCAPKAPAAGGAAPQDAPRPDPTRYGDWEKSGRCIDF